MSLRISPASKSVGLAAALAISTGGSSAAAQPAGSTSFTEAQATSGRDAYVRNCAECHLENLRGGFGPALAGPNFTSIWGAEPAGTLFELTRNTMPPGAEASLGDSVYLDIVAYILQVNGHAAGAEALRADSAVAIAPGAPGSGHGDVRAGAGRSPLPAAGR